MRRARLCRRRARGARDDRTPSARSISSATMPVSADRGAENVNAHRLALGHRHQPDGRGARRKGLRAAAEKPCARAVTFVNTASMAGFLPGTGFGALHRDQICRASACPKGCEWSSSPPGIGVSVLCPGWVTTKITESRRNWPKEYGDAAAERDGPIAATDRGTRQERHGAERGRRAGAEGGARTTNFTSSPIRTCGRPWRGASTVSSRHTASSVPAPQERAQ